MDRIDFINSINHNGRSVIDLVSNYFDQNMLLFNRSKFTRKIKLEEEGATLIF